MALYDLLQIASMLLAVILVLYSVLDFFSLAHQVKVKKEKDQRLVNHLVLMIVGAFLFALSRIVMSLTDNSTIPLGLDVLALLSMVLAFYVHLRKTAKAYL